ncbi:hypothetical protein Ciccas_008572 [Cichlidogyrus casuarinus]|uniref:Uncharacterized protein n=1 Tax=Cichlidogyrus casuarinus TaxID=1844966 RepID=A0ABD2Q0W5_9PLAT
MVNDLACACFILNPDDRAIRDELVAMPKIEINNVLTKYRALQAVSKASNSTAVNDVSHFTSTRKFFCTFCTP